MVAFDQLVRHPAMTPQKLLRWYAPFFLAFAVGVAANWPRLLVITHFLFTVGLVVIGALLIRKLPSRSVRLSIGILMAAFTFLVFGGLVAEMLAIVALWVAFDVSRRQAF